MEIQNYIENYLIKKSDIEHSKQVEKLSLMFFEKLCTIFPDKLEYPKKHKNLLEIAAKLHDIGVFFEGNSIKPHNKIGAKLVLENKIDGLDKTENLIVANIIRYHRGKSPKEKHKIFNKLDEDSKQLVLILSSILKVADALDYNHFSFVENIELSLNSNNKELFLNILPDISNNTEFKKVITKKKKLFERVFETTLNF